MNPRLAQGFSLIEVLVTLVVVTIGLLGMVTLQGQAVRFTQDSVQRNIAARLGNDLIELMRAKPDGLPATSGFYKAAGQGFPDTPSHCVPLPTSARDQLGCWAAKAAQALPGAETLLADEFYVCRSQTQNSCGGTGSAVEIQIAWQAREGECPEANGTDSSVCHYRLRSQL